VLPFNTCGGGEEHKVVSCEERSEELKVFNRQYDVASLQPSFVSP